MVNESIRWGAPGRPLLLLVLAGLVLSACDHPGLARVPELLGFADPQAPLDSDEPPPPIAVPVAPVSSEALDGSPTPAPPTPAPAIPAPASVIAGGARHEVAPGDTLYSIARRHDVSLRDLIAANGLHPPYTLSVGQVLILPLEEERGDHLVAPGETVYSLSRRFGVDMSALVRANGIPPPYALRAGQRLVLPPPSTRAVAAVAPTVAPVPIPGAAPPPPRGRPLAAPDLPPPPPVNPARLIAALPDVPLPAANPRRAGRALARAGAGDRVALPPQAAPRTGPVPEPPARAGSRFHWPVRGKVVLPFGPQNGGLHNDGINIAAAQGTLVRAAENGVVVYAGNELRGYGNMVLLKHSGGWVTAYAHTHVNLVRRGAVVRRGDPIAKVGDTGSVSSPQLHFEVRKGSRALNPIKHMVPRSDLARR